MANHSTPDKVPPPEYDDPYSEILVKINDLLHEADFHQGKMSDKEYWMFTSIRILISEGDPHFYLSFSQES